MRKQDSNMDGRFVLLVVSLCFCHGGCLKIMVVPLNMGSHLLFMGEIGSELTKQGHDVVMYVPHNSKSPQELAQKVRISTYKAPYDVPMGNSDEFAQLEINAVVTDSFLEWIEIQEKIQVLLFESMTRECESLYENYAEIKAEQFDLAIMDGVAYGCFYTLPYKLGIPYASFSLPYLMWAYRIPHLSSQWPNVMMTTSDRMDFWERLQVFSIDLMDHYFANDTDTFCRKYVPERLPKGDATLLLESAMWWHFYDISVGYPKPSMPNTLDMGDVMARPPKPLPQEYKDIMDISERPVILVSLGSHFDHVPKEWLQKFCNAFNSVEYTVIWKLKISPPCQVNENIHLQKWVPQNDLLAHPKLALFITHCGINSVIESISHGKPMIGLPITLDQPYNAKVVETKGYGKVLNLKTFTSDELVDSIYDVIGNGSFPENARKGGEILLDKVTTPGERMSFWAEHIVKFGDSHLRTKAHNLSLAEFLMVDIFAFLFLCLLMSVIMFVLFVICCVKCCKRQLCAKSVKQKAE